MGEATHITVAVLTVSDRCAAGVTGDRSGPVVAALARDRLRATVTATAVVADDRDAIARQLRGWAHADTTAPDLILTTGGTGLAPRDVTPEATAGVLDRRHPALLELARLRCFPATPKAFLSRGEAGTIHRTLVVNLPGSPAGASEVLTALLDVLPHAIRMVRGTDTNHG